MRKWIVPAVFAGMLFVIVRPAVAQFSGGELVEYLKTNNVEVGSGPNENSYRQIYYIYDGQKKIITNSNYTNANPVTEGEYIIWGAQIDNGWRIMTYHIPTGQTVELTPRGINTNHQIVNGNIIWEGQDDNGNWQIFLFNGVSVKQLTFDEVSLNSDIERDYIVFSTKDVTGTWRGRTYSISQDKFQDVAVGEEMQKIGLKDGRIFLGEEEFPLTVEDLFLLDFAPLAGQEATPSAVTEEDILEEINASPSAQVQEASSSGELTE